MRDLSELIMTNPIVPYIRQCEFAVRKPWNFPMRRLLDYLIVYVQEGHCRFTVDGEAYDFHAGEYCLVQPGSLVDLEGLTNTVTPYAHFDIFYNGKRELSFPTRSGQTDLSGYQDLIQPRLNDIYGIHVPIRFLPRNLGKFRDSLLQTVDLWQHREPMAQLKAQHLMMELIIYLLEDYCDHKLPPRSSAQSFNWVSSYFSFHLAEPLTLQDMAAKANLSPSRFSALFRRHFGVSPHRYLLDMRVDHARELLETTELSQEEIAQYCGFADIHHFSKTFRKKTGQAPGFYRRNRS